jgi:probable rRNA maturation factor
VLRLAVQGAAGHAGVPARTTLRRWVLRALENSTDEAQLTLRWVGRAEGRRLNREFRRRDYATNVLTFDYARAPLTADLVLCVPVIRREARAQGKSLRAHLAHLVIHGVLHARGFDHQDERAARQMEARERRLLASLRIADPYLPVERPPKRRGAGAAGAPK